MLYNHHHIQRDNIITTMMLKGYIKTLRKFTFNKKGHSRDIPASQSFNSATKKLNQTQQQSTFKKPTDTTTTVLLWPSYRSMC